jgi:molecular chaperone DnaK
MPWEEEDTLTVPSVPPPEMPDDFVAELELPRAPALPTATPAKKPPPPPVRRLPAPTVKTRIVPAFQEPAPPVAVRPPSERPEPTLPPRPAPLLIDVTPISLGVETAGGFCDFLISANTPVPCDRTRVFLTASDGQTSVVVKVAQGESQRFGENTLLGDLHLTNLVAAARGEVQVAVTFEIDVDGILNVRAKDEGSGRETTARLHMVGTQADAVDVQAMLVRQTRHEIS